MTVMRPRIVACRMSEGEFNAFVAICEKNDLTYQEMMHAILIDALLDEGYDALRPNEPERCESSTETGEGCRPAA